MDYSTLLKLTCLVTLSAAWSAPFYPVQPGPPIRITRFVPNRHRQYPHPHQRVPILAPVHESEKNPESDSDEQQQRPKRDHDYDFERDHDVHDHDNTRGITGPVHTFVKTDKNANYKWGVRHHVGNKYAS